MTTSLSMTNIAAQVLAAGATYDTSTPLPYPNIYWATVRTSDGRTVDTYIAGDHTNAALAKLCNWCVEHHRFRPHRSNSVIKMRRLLLDDVLHNPAAYDVALATAVANRESDIIDSLKALPTWVAGKVGIQYPDLSAADSLWQRLSSELGALTHRALR